MGFENELCMRVGWLDQSCIVTCSMPGGKRGIIIGEDYDYFEDVRDEWMDTNSIPRKYCILDFNGKTHYLGEKDIVMNKEEKDIIYDSKIFVAKTEDKKALADILNKAIMKYQENEERHRGRK